MRVRKESKESKERKAGHKKNPPKGRFLYAELGNNCIEGNYIASNYILL